MGKSVAYYTRILTKSEAVVSFSDLRTDLETKRPDVVLKLEDGTEDSWKVLSLAHKDGQHISIIERNPVTQGTMGEEELSEFMEIVEDCKPASGAEWLMGYLPNIKAIYAFQVIFTGAERDEGWEAMDKVKEHLWRKLGGLLQADQEGISNEEGSYIIWQFFDEAKSLVPMAVLDKQGRWITFEMDVGNKKHRKAFWKGKVPRGARIVKPQT